MVHAGDKHGASADHDAFYTLNVRAVQRWPAVADETHRQLRRHLALLDTVASTGAWWLSSERPSILSLYLVMLLRWIKAFPAYARHSIRLADYPALQAMAKGLETRPSLVAALHAEGLCGAVYSNPPCETPAEPA
jgi:glutathione S-transferase